MNELSVVAILGVITTTLFSVIVYFLKQLITKVDIVYDSVIAQREINKTLFRRLDKIEGEILGR